MTVIFSFMPNSSIVPNNSIVHKKLIQGGKLVKFNNLSVDYLYRGGKLKNN